MVRVLHIFHNMGNGGIEHFVMDFYRHIDRNKVQFDFLTSVDEKGYFDDEIQKLGGKLYRAYPLKKNPIKNYLDIMRIVKENKYNIVHRHTGSAFGYYDLRAARRGDAKHLILHSHNPQVGKPILHFISEKLLKIDCIPVACSKEAGEFLFGKKTKVKIINNAIDCDKYEYNADVRKQVREELGVVDSFIVGHIGRFEEQKNHKKLLDIFSEILKIKPNSKLICVGSGKLMEERKIQAKELGILDRILFLGNRDDVERIMQAFDVFVFPSLYEGFSITQIEIQVNGLTVFTSENKVPSSSNIAGNVYFIPLEESAQLWAKKIMRTNVDRDYYAIDAVKKAGYDIHNVASELSEYYQELEWKE
ncbi:glycosyltransferase family 1 protein [Faecalimonas umbilicata]|uniref:glycosyltransferase family 1 protein n=1 Tax=Faecalimonas umbilicata TaxID=1912855 RepID=UPI0039914D9B